MKNKLLVAILAVFILFIGGWVVVNLNENKSQNNEVTNQSAVEQSEVSTMTQSTENEQDSASIESQNSAEKGEYLAYDEQSFNDSQNERLLFFYASWCPKCRALDSDIKNTGVPSGKTIFKVDFDDSQELRQKYGVTLQTTIVKVDENGNLVSKYVAYDDPTLNNVLSNL
jgi:thiol-disulfide isomerase/thioredoxin